MRVLISEQILKEYSDKIFNQLISKFKSEKPSLSNEVIKAYIERFYQLKKSPKIKEKDITKYTWAKLEQTVDLNQKKQIKTGGVEISNSEYIYNKNNLKILVGNTLESCIKYGTGYSFCISARGDRNLYAEYKYGEDFTPYFVIDEERTKEQNADNNFVDPLHLIIIMVKRHEEDDEIFYEYQLTTANNDGDDRYMYWDSIVDIQPKLKGLKNLFIPREGNKYEKQEYLIKKNHEDTLNELNIEYDDKDVTYHINFLRQSFLKIIDGILNNELSIFRYNGKDEFNNNVAQKVAEKEPSIERWKKNLGVPLFDVSYKQLKKGLDQDEYLKKAKKILLSYLNELNKFKLLNKK